MCVYIVGRERETREKRERERETERDRQIAPKKSVVFFLSSFVRSSFVVVRRRGVVVVVFAERSRKRERERERVLLRLVFSLPARASFGRDGAARLFSTAFKNAATTATSTKE
jgi:hypothetical protein